MEPPFELIILSAEDDIAGEIKTTNQLLSLGLNTFHLRKPLWNIEQTQRFIEAIPAEFHGCLVIHSHFQLADRYKLKGIHLNEFNRKLIAQFNSEKILSASFHSLKDIAEDSFPYRYIFLSPVFNSISKPGYTANFDLNCLPEELSSLRLKKHLQPNVIALGGINAENINIAKAAGFSGAALLGGIWKSVNPIATYLQIRSIAAAI